MATCSHLSNVNAIASLQGKMVYKDECSKCFTDNKDPGGIDLCLKCLNGGCTTKDNHSKLHYEHTSHPLVLNVKQVLKPKPKVEGEAEKKEITKLAIGKEGGADFSDEEWETIYTLKCIPCGKELDQTPLKGIVESTKQAESSYKKSMLVAWELELQPCEHCLMLNPVDGVKLADKNTSHCGDCELSTNLWLCLTCGHLGCGRKNFDGTGGNNHAIDHHDKTKHPMVVKMGTITAEGTASVYCYTCNDDVTDPHLADHLRHFGLRIEAQQKTEKSVAEMNLDANLNLSLSQSLEKGQKLIPVFGPGLTGLANLGNSCYLNAVYQVLMGLEDFQCRYWKEGINHLKTCTKFTPDCFHCQLAKLGAGLQSGEYSIKKEAQHLGTEENKEVEYYQDGIRPMMLKTMVGKGHPEFSGNKMQDAAEYFGHFLTYLQKAEKAAGLPDLTKIFSFKMANKLTCLKCHGVKIREATANELRVPLPYDKSKDLKEAYDIKGKELWANFETPEVVTTNCPNCHSNQSFEKRVYVKTWPKYLVVVLSRFVFDDWVPKKLHGNVLFSFDAQDMSFLNLPPKAPGEVDLPDDAGAEEEEDEASKVNKEALENLKSMGFSENRCIRALIEHKNNAEAAINWLFEKADDESLDLPLPKKKVMKSGDAGGIHISEENIAMMASMGITEKQARIALGKCDNNVERAIEFVFSHPEEMEVEEQNQGAPKVADAPGQDIETKTPKYVLEASLIHLGSSVHAGHYVCYVKKDGKWYYFNDEKVHSIEDPPVGKGYLLIWKRV